MKSITPYLILTGFVFALASVILWGLYRSERRQLRALSDSAAVLNRQYTLAVQQNRDLTLKASAVQATALRSQLAFLRQKDSLSSVIRRMPLRQQATQVVRTITQHDTLLVQTGFVVHRDSVCYDSLTHAGITQRILRGDLAETALEVSQQATAQLREFTERERAFYADVAGYGLFRSKRKAILHHQRDNPLP